MPRCDGSISRWVSVFAKIHSKSIFRTDFLDNQSHVKKSIA